MEKISGSSPSSTRCFNTVHKNIFDLQSQKNKMLSLCFLCLFRFLIIVIVTCGCSKCQKAKKNAKFVLIKSKIHNGTTLQRSQSRNQHQRTGSSPADRTSTSPNNSQHKSQNRYLVHGNDTTDKSTK